MFEVRDVSLRYASAVDRGSARDARARAGVLGHMVYHGLIRPSGGTGAAP